MESRVALGEQPSGTCTLAKDGLRPSLDTPPEQEGEGSCRAALGHAEACSWRAASGSMAVPWKKWGFVPP